jgi:putative redox protein
LFHLLKKFEEHVHISRVLTEMGIAVFRFDFTGLADSEGEFSSTTLSQQIDDVLAAARFLAENFVSASLMIGHSLGGSAMQAAAAQIPSARGLVLIATPDHPNHVGHLLADTATGFGRWRSRGQHRRQSLQIEGRVFQGP